MEDILKNPEVQKMIDESRPMIVIVDCRECRSPVDEKEVNSEGLCRVCQKTMIAPG